MSPFPTFDNKWDPTQCSRWETQPASRFTSRGSKSCAMCVKRSLIVQKLFLFVPFFAQFPSPRGDSEQTKTIFKMSLFHHHYGPVPYPMRPEPLAIVAQHCAEIHQSQIRAGACKIIAGELFQLPVSEISRACSSFDTVLIVTFIIASAFEALPTRVEPLPP